MTGVFSSNANAKLQSFSTFYCHFFSTTKCHFFDHLQLAAGKSLAETTEPKGSCHFQMEENKNLKETRGKGDGQTDGGLRQ